MSKSGSAIAYLRPGDASSRLDGIRFEQDRDLARTRPVDVLVVGGGITGCGVALDAASRGLSVALVERGDLASGTSAYSSKLIHSGLRYLASGELGLAWQSTREKGILMQRTAGHLVRTLTQVVPIPAGERGSAMAMSAGLLAADAMQVAGRAGTRGHGRARVVPIDRAAPMVPGLATERYDRAGLITDGQLVDDARLVVAVARTAAAYGAQILTHTQALQVSGSGALVRDALDGAEYEIRAKHVVSAIGVWAGDLDPDVHLRPSRGTHLVVPSSVLGSPAGSLTVAHPAQAHRFLFALPQADSAGVPVTYLGITDVPLAPGQDRDPSATISTQAEVHEILDGISSALEIPIRPEHVIATYAGLRPLVDPGAEAPHTGADAGAAEAGPASATADLSRAHLVRTASDGMITVTGGKLTTYRLMAQDVVDLITDTPCRTTDIALAGASPGMDADAEQRRWDGAGVRPADLRRRLATRYGAESALLAAAIEAAPELGQALSADSPARLAELWFAREYEGARTVDDVCSRRLRLDVLGATATQSREHAEQWLTGNATPSATSLSA